VFYVTDLFGAKVESQPRQTTMRRALLNAFTPSEGAKAAKAGA
jgi:hypothetical protein